MYLWDNDVSGSYRIPKYHSGAAGLFAYGLLNYVLLYTGDTLGPNTSPQEYEPFVHDGSFLAEYLSRDQILVLKHQKILSLVK